MKTKMKSIIILVTIAMSTFLTTSCDHQVTPPQQVLSYEEANVLEENFKTTRTRVINASLGYEDTREFWFSLDSLKRYIEYVEYEAKKQNLSNLGVRVYFAAYPKESNYPDPGFSTVFMVPTTKIEASPLKQGFLPIETTNENIEDLKALNYSQGGHPPKDLE